MAAGLESEAYNALTYSVRDYSRIHSAERPVLLCLLQPETFPCPPRVPLPAVSVLKRLKASATF